jgi:hypothetical protein
MGIRVQAARQGHQNPSKHPFANDLSELCGSRSGISLQRTEDP